MKKKTFKSIKRDGKSFNLLTLPGTNFFQFEIVNKYGSNIERVVKNKIDKNVYGISHFIEHLSFKSTKDFTTQELIEIRKNEGKCNAGTGYDKISYFFKTTMNKKDIAINFVCNIALNDFKKVTQEEFDSEKKVVFNEVKQYADDDQTMFFFDSSKTLMGYEKDDNIISTPEVIDTFTLEDAMAIKEIFLSHDDVDYNIVYDNEISSEEEIVQMVEKELEKFKAPDSSTIKVTKAEYQNGLSFPKLGTFIIENESEQAMTAINIDAVDNMLVASAVCDYLAKVAKDTSLDDLIRQKNGLTYNVYFFVQMESYKPYINFICDVTKGTQDKMVELFRESINASVDSWDRDKHARYIKVNQLQNTLDNLDQELYLSWFDTNFYQAKALDNFRSILAEDITKARNAIDENLLTYENMSATMQKIKKLVNSDSFGKVTNI